jgi:ATP-dependent protease ClpP protease subunit
VDIFIFEQITTDTLTRIQKEVSGTDPINLHINSIGGDVFAGKGIFDFLNALPNEINVSIDGFAGSIATLIMLAGDTITASEGSFIMIHRASSMKGGNQNQLRDQVALLEGIDDFIIDAFETKTGLSRDQINQLIDKDTFIPAKEAEQLGFIDSVGPALEIAAQLNLTNNNKMEIIDKLKAQAAALLGNVSKDEETQKVIDKLAKEAKEQAEAEIKAKTQDPATALTSEMVTNADYLPYKAQLDAFVKDSIEFMAAEQKRNDEIQASIPILVKAEIVDLLAKIQSKAEIPAAKNAFSEKNEPKKVDMQNIKEMQEKRVKQHNDN